MLGTQKLFKHCDVVFGNCVRYNNYKASDLGNHRFVLIRL